MAVISYQTFAIRQAVCTTSTAGCSLCERRQVVVVVDSTVRVRAMVVRVGVRGVAT